MPAKAVTAATVFSMVSAVRTFFMLRDAMLRALVPVTLITFCAVMALAPLYVTLSMMTRTMTTKTAK